MKGGVIASKGYVDKLSCQVFTVTVILTHALMLLCTHSFLLTCADNYYF